MFVYTVSVTIDNASHYLCQQNNEIIGLKPCPAGHECYLSDNQLLKGLAFLNNTKHDTYTITRYYEDGMYIYR